MEDERKKILLVDDSMTSLDLLEKVFVGKDDFEIIGRARNGAEAVKLYQTHQPDLVFMDIIMPIMDGIQALRMIMQLNKEARVFMVSSVGGVGEKAAEVLRLGARGIIAKPFESEEIFKMMEAV